MVLFNPFLAQQREGSWVGAEDHRSNPTPSPKGWMKDAITWPGFAPVFPLLTAAAAGKGTQGAGNGA